MTSPTPFPIDNPLESTFAELETVVDRGRAAGVPGDSRVYVTTTTFGATRHGSRLAGMTIVAPTHTEYGDPRPGGL